MHRFALVAALCVHEVKLAGHAAYRGAMLGLRLSLPRSKEPCRVRSIGLARPGTPKPG